MTDSLGKHIKNDSLALGLDDRFSRKPRWMSGMALYLVQSETVRFRQKKAKKVHTHGKRPRHI